MNDLLHWNSLLKPQTKKPSAQSKPRRAEDWLWSSSELLLLLRLGAGGWEYGGTLGLPGLEPGSRGPASGTPESEKALSPIPKTQKPLLTVLFTTQPRQLNCFGCRCAAAFFPQGFRVHRQGVDEAVCTRFPVQWRCWLKGSSLEEPFSSIRECEGHVSCRRKGIFLVPVSRCAREASCLKLLCEFPPLNSESLGEGIASVGSCRTVTHSDGR